MCTRPDKHLICPHEGPEIAYSGHNNVFVTLAGTVLTSYHLQRHQDISDRLVISELRFCADGEITTDAPAISEKIFLQRKYPGSALGRAGILV